VTVKQGGASLETGSAATIEWRHAWHRTTNRPLSGPSGSWPWSLSLVTAHMRLAGWPS